MQKMYCQSHYFCKIECFNYILASSLEFYEPYEKHHLAIDSLGNPAVIAKDLKVKLNQATRCQLRSFDQINDLFSSIDVQCMCKQSRILAVQVSQTALQLRFTEQFFSTSQFTDAKNSQSQHHESKLAPPPPPLLFGIFNEVY